MLSFFPIRHITFLLTERCNHNCSHCYQDRSRQRDLSSRHADRVMDLAFRHGAPKLSVTFSGGEPLLLFPRLMTWVEKAVVRADQTGRDMDWTLFSNGSLIHGRILDFLAYHRFHVQLSIGPVCRRSFDESEKNMEQIISTKGISLSTNTVWNPENVRKLYQSVKFLYRRGVREIGISTDNRLLWETDSLHVLHEQLLRTASFAAEEYRKNGRFLTPCFLPDSSRGIPACGAGGNRLTIDPGGDVWGCSLFPHLQWDRIIESPSNYRYGSIEDLRWEKNHITKIRNHYRELRTDHYWSGKGQCFLCSHLAECRICPAQNYTYIQGRRSLFQVPEPVCRMNRIVMGARRHFLKKSGLGDATGINN